jgi:hypothetical protein
MYDISVIVILVIMVLFIVYNFYIDYTDWVNTGNTFAEGFNDYGKGMDNIGNKGRQLLPLIDYGWKGFKKIDGKFKQISETKDEIYAINIKNEIYKCKKPCDGNWEKVQGTLKQISASSNDMWGVNESNKIFKKESTGWKEIGGQLKQVSASGNGYVWGINEKNQVFSCKKPCKPWAGDGNLIKQKAEPLYKRPNNTYKPRDEGKDLKLKRKLKKGEGNCRAKDPATYKVLKKKIVPDKCKAGYTQNYKTYTNHPVERKWVGAARRYYPATYRQSCRRVYWYRSIGWRHIRRCGWWCSWIPIPYWKYHYRNSCHNVVSRSGYWRTLKPGYYKTIRGPWRETHNRKRWIDAPAVTHPATRAFCDKEYPGWKEAGMGIKWVPTDLNLDDRRCRNYGSSNGRNTCNARGWGSCRGKWVRTMTSANSPEDCANKLNEEGILSYRARDKSCVFIKKSRAPSWWTVGGLKTPCWLEGPGGWGSGYKLYKSTQEKYSKENPFIYKSENEPGWKLPYTTASISESQYTNNYNNKNWAPDAACEDGLTCSKPNGGKQRLPGIYWGLDATNQWSENANTGFCYDKNDTPYQRSGESEAGYFHGIPYKNLTTDTQQWDQEHRHLFWVSNNLDTLSPKMKKYSVKILTNDWNTIQKRVQRYCSNAKLMKTESGVYTFKCMGHENNNLPDWKYHNGTFTQVSGGEKFIWGVNNNDNTIWRKLINGDGVWKKIKGSAKFINATNKNIVYIVNNNNEVFKCAKPCDDGKWEKIDQGIKGTKDFIKAAQVSGYSHVVWATNKLNDIFKTVNENILPFGQTKLGKCEGNCTTDKECQKGLKCYERKHGGDIPDGCKAGGPGDIPTYGYCYDPAWNYVPPAPPDEKGICTTEESCKKIAKEKGFKLGTEEQSSTDKLTVESFVDEARPFVENSETKGLYSYKGGKYKGIAFFGKGGTPEEMVAPFPKDSNKYRPEDLKKGEEYEEYYCSSGTGERLGKWNAKSKKDCITQCKGKYPSRKGHKCFTDPFPPPATWKEGGTGSCSTGCKRPKCITGNCKDVIIDGVIYKSCTGSCSNVEGAGIDGGCKYDIDCPEKNCGVVYFNVGDTCSTDNKTLSRTAFDEKVGAMSPQDIKNLQYNGPLDDNYKHESIKPGEKTIFNKIIMKQVLANKNLIPSDINIKVEKRGNYVRIGKNLMNDVSYIRNVPLPDINNEDYETLGRIVVKIKKANKPPNNNITLKLTNTVNNILTPSLKSKSTTGMYGDNSNALMSDGKNQPYNSIWSLFS